MPYEEKNAFCYYQRMLKWSAWDGSDCTQPGVLDPNLRHFILIRKVVSPNYSLLYSSQKLSKIMGFISDPPNQESLSVKPKNLFFYTFPRWLQGQASSALQEYTVVLFTLLRWWWLNLFIRFSPQNSLKTSSFAIWNRGKDCSYVKALLHHSVVGCAHKTAAVSSALYSIRHGPRIKGFMWYNHILFFLS